MRASRTRLMVVFSLDWPARLSSEHIQKHQRNDKRPPPSRRRRQIEPISTQHRKSGCRKKFKIVLASSKLSPILNFVAQQHIPFLDSSMVEHAAVNRAVVGSSPTRGARNFKPTFRGGLFCYPPILNSKQERYQPRCRSCFHKKAPSYDGALKFKTRYSP